MAISRMQNPQQLQGIGSLRQPYGLGKLVKKAFRGVKKIAKSPIGKAALMYAGTAGLGNLAGGLGGAQKWGGMQWLRPSNTLGLGQKGWGNIGQLGSLFGKKGKFGNLLYSGVGDKRKLSKNKMFGWGAAGLMAAPFVQSALKMGPYADDEEVDETSWT